MIIFDNGSDIIIAYTKKCKRQRLHFLFLILHGLPMRSNLFQDLTFLDPDLRQGEDFCQSEDLDSNFRQNEDFLGEDVWVRIFVRIAIIFREANHSSLSGWI